MDLVADSVSKNFVELDADGTAGEARRAAGGTLHIVVLERDFGALGILEAGQLEELPDEIPLREVVRSGPPLVTVPAELTLAEAAQAPAMRAVEAGAERALVLAGDRPLGIWAGTTLAHALLSFGQGSRLAADALLPGKIERIPKVCRQCGYSESADVCLDAVSFAEKPDEMPECRNPKALQPHRFVW